MSEGFIDLFVQDNTEGNRPHFKGYIKMDGVKYEFACWPAKSGKPGVFSGKVKPEQPKQDSQPAPAQAPELSDEIPF